MDAPCQGTLLRIFLNDSDRHEGKPLHEAILLKARERGLAGATVLRAAMGFGKKSVLKSAKLLDISASLPLVIEIIDTEERVKSFLPDLASLRPLGLVTMERVEVLSPGTPV
jgi:PII-like signaling protein